MVPVLAPPVQCEWLCFPAESSSSVGTSNSPLLCSCSAEHPPPLGLRTVVFIPLSGRTWCPGSDGHTPSHVSCRTRGKNDTSRFVKALPLAPSPSPVVPEQQDLHFSGLVKNARFH